MKKQKLKIFIIVLPLIFICIFISFFYFYLFDNSINLISFKGKSQLSDLLKYKAISGEIIGLSPIDININNLMISNNSLSTTSFHQKEPNKNYKVIIYSKGNNKFTIEQYLSNKNTGVYNLTLANNNLNGTFTDYLNNKTYQVKSILTNYSNEIETNYYDTTSNKLMDSIFLNYPIYTGYFNFEYFKLPNKNAKIEYNQYTNNIIEYSVGDPSSVVTLKLSKPPYHAGIELKAYSGDKYIGYFYISYNSSNNYWMGDFCKTVDSINYKYPVFFKGEY